MQKDVHQVFVKVEAVTQMLKVLVAIDSSLQGLMLNLSLYYSISGRKLKVLKGWSLAEELYK